MMSGKARAGTAKERSVFVGNIPYDVTEEMLKEIFSGAGTVVNFRLVTDRETGKPKGYGFCEYADGATALSAMRNLNGYEVNGRNLRVDFADGGDKSGGGGGGGNHHHNGGGGGGGGYSNDKQHTTAVSGEVIIQAIENAISRFGPLKLYDMLVELKEHARQRPDHTKSMLTANPALTHAIVQCFKTLNIPIPSSTEMPPALLAPPPPHLHAPPLMGRPMGPPPPQRSSMGGPPGVGGGGGILGMAPPGPPPPPPGSMGMPPPPVGAQAPPAKAGGTRWSARPGPLAGLMAPPGPGGMAGPPPLQQQQQQPAALPSYQGPPPPLMNMPPPPMGVTAAQQQMNRDPRRARDPRLAKRPLAPEPAVDPKRPRPDDHQFHQQQHQQQQHQQHQGPPSQGNGTFDAIAELARDMTPQKLNMLPPNERQILMMYMQQHGMPFPS